MARMDLPGSAHRAGRAPVSQSDHAAGAAGGRESREPGIAPRRTYRRKQGGSDDVHNRGAAYLCTMQSASPALQFRTEPSAASARTIEISRSDGEPDGGVAVEAIVGPAWWAGPSRGGAGDRAHAAGASYQVTSEQSVTIRAVLQRRRRGGQERASKSPDRYRPARG
jgi:hypothetical protein